MKKIINGKTYNTETAQWVGSWSNNCCANDFKSATLWRTKKGAYFLYRYDFRGGETIVPLTREAAFEWCQENGAKVVMLNGCMLHRLGSA